MSSKTFSLRLTRYYAWYSLGFLVLLLCLAILEKEGVPRTWIGYLFMVCTIFVYASIGLFSRTADISEYYVAGRRVPAVFNGMATAADWISAASFLSLAGGLYLHGFDALAYLIGWTGGFCLVALLITPYIRKRGQYTVAEFLGSRFAGNAEGNSSNHAVRILAVMATVMISFTYVVAQIYGVGLITSRFIGVDFTIGIFLGLASILVCSFLGGMRAVTWTQVAQYIIILIALLIPVSWLSIKHLHTPVPQIAYGTLLPTLAEKEQGFAADAKEQEVRALFARQALALQQQIATLPGSLAQGRAALQQHLDHLSTSNASLIEVKAATRALANYPKTVEQARLRWGEALKSKLARAEPPSSQFHPYEAKTEAQSIIKRNNFIALVFSLMMGTAALPHVLIRGFTTPSVRASRESVFWSLFFITLLYLSLPALAILLKLDIYQSLVGLEYAKLPPWVSYWASVDKINPLVNISDINHDGIVQLAEIAFDGDILVLATPEITGLPYVISALVAAGGLAAALSTADGLLLTISNSLSHDIYFGMLDRDASTQKRVTISKLLLLIVALLAAWVASLKPADILSLVGAAFSLAASTLFPTLVLGIFWKRANWQGAIAGMLLGFAVCVGYMLASHPIFGGNAANQWWHIAPISAAIFGVPAGALGVILVSLLTRAPCASGAEWVDYIRAP